MTDEQFTELTTAIRRIAYGDNTGPTGLEGVAMSLGGVGGGERRISDN